MSNVRDVYSNSRAFVVIFNSGAVSAYGQSFFGEDLNNPRPVGSILSSKSINKIYNTSSAFAALFTDGSVVSWGSLGGDYEAVEDELSDPSNKVILIKATGSAFCAQREDGSIITWGSVDGGASLY